MKRIIAAACMMIGSASFAALPPHMVVTVMTLKFLAGQGIAKSLGTNLVDTSKPVNSLDILPAGNHFLQMPFKQQCSSHKSPENKAIKKLLSQQERPNVKSRRPNSASYLHKKPYR